MCDPVSLSIASTVVGVAGSAASAIGQMNAAKKQRNAVEQWTVEQKQFRDQEKVRQEELRLQGDAARKKGLEQVAGDAQARMQEEEAARLGKFLERDTGLPAETSAPVSAADAAIAAGSGNGPGDFKTDLAKKINETAKDSRARIAALANVSAYGSSMYGLGTEIPMLQGNTGQEINQANVLKSGSLAAFGQERAIDPLQVTYTPSPLAGLFSEALSFGAQGMGNAFGNPLVGDTSAFPKPFISPQVASFQGPRKPLAAPYTGGSGYLF